MPSLPRTLYWIVSGALMGIGLIAFGLLYTPFLLGAVLALYGVRRMGPSGFWIAIVGMGVAPAALLAFRYLTADSSTVFGGNIRLGIGLFGAIALGGIIWGVVENRRIPHPRT